MKIRIASSIALAAGLALGLTGCNLMAPQATTVPYAPSDGIDVDLEGAYVRNMLLIADESGENFNVVFTGVNNGTEDVRVTVNFVNQGSQQAAAEFTIEPGTTEFGNPEGDIPPTLVSLPDVIAGSTVDAYFQIPGANEVQRDVPVLDGTLSEYADYVLEGPGELEVDEEALDDEVATDEFEDDATTPDPGANPAEGSQGDE